MCQGGAVQYKAAAVKLLSGHASPPRRAVPRRAGETADEAFYAWQ